MVKPSSNRRYAACVEYDGSDYYGWQSLKTGLPTIQQNVENALTRVADKYVGVVCAGRTDTGVHSTQQIIHFDSLAKRNTDNWLCGANSYLPKTISLKWVRIVSEKFHARFSAIARQYRYIILNSAIPSVLLNKKVTWCYKPLNAEVMHNAAQLLKGEHDFTSYRSAHCQSKSPIRTIKNIVVKRYDQLIVIDIRANAFLHHMVRNVVGVLMDVGSGKRNIDWVLEVLASRDRRSASVTAPPYGLYLTHVYYPSYFELPIDHLSPRFLVSVAY